MVWILHQQLFWFCMQGSQKVHNMHTFCLSGTCQESAWLCLPCIPHLGMDCACLYMPQFLYCLLGLRWCSWAKLFISIWMLFLGMFLLCPPFSSILPVYVSFLPFFPYTQDVTSFLYCLSCTFTSTWSSIIIFFPVPFASGLHLLMSSSKGASHFFPHVSYFSTSHFCSLRLNSACLSDLGKMLSTFMARKHPSNSFSTRLALITFFPSRLVSKLHSPINTHMGSCRLNTHSLKTQPWQL